MPALIFNTNADNKPTVSDARNLAAWLHTGQNDPSGKTYILHPERVKDNLLRVFPDASDDVIMAAWLHDTMEDCEYNDEKVDEKFLEDFGYSQTTIQIVRLLTKPGEDDREYDQVIDDLINATGVSEEVRRGAIMVKIADNMDNLHPVRIEELRNSQMERDEPGKAQRLYNRYVDSVNKLSAAISLDPAIVFATIKSAPPLKTDFKYS